MEEPARKARRPSRKACLVISSAETRAGTRQPRIVKSRKAASCRHTAWMRFNDNFAHSTSRACLGRSVGTSGAIRHSAVRPCDLAAGGFSGHHRVAGHVGNLSPLPADYTALRLHFPPRRCADARRRIHICAGAAGFPDCRPPAPEPQSVRQDRPPLPGFCSCAGRRYVRGRKMLAFLVICVVMTISSAYELIEWLAAVIFGEGAYEFLGTQGDMWDTQADMLFALIGAVAALLLLSRTHDRQLARFRFENN